MSRAKSGRDATPLSFQGIRRGFLANAYLVVFVLPFGVAFGAAAVERGVSIAAALAMSAFMFAGASQFAALELWREPLPIAMLTLTAFAVNARHIVMGAAMAPWALGVDPWKRYASVAIMSDPNWAYAMARHAQGERDFGVLVGCGILLWIAWLAGTLVGAVLGSGLGDPKLFGLDALMVVFFGVTLLAQWKGRDDVLPWLVAGSVGVAGLYLLPAGWHVIAGALAGGITGVVIAERRGTAAS